jgi:pyruvate dehydrogenase E2 component (dihydrolipoamide acetyltransferase)
MHTVIMPQVGQDVPSATIVEWFKKENDPVLKGEVLCAVESDKATFEVEAEEAGVLLKILHPEGSEVAILQPIAHIGNRGESAPSS